MYEGREAMSSEGHLGSTLSKAEGRGAVLMEMGHDEATRYLFKF